VKIKIIGFKVGRSRPTANRTINATKLLAEISEVELWKEIGVTIYRVLEKSDFISIRRVDD